LCGYLGCWLRDRGVPDVADLAMILFVCMVVPVADRMGRERSQRQNDRDSQYTLGNSFRHARLDVHIQNILPLSSGNGKLFGPPVANSFHEKALVHSGGKPVRRKSPGGQIGDTANTSRSIT